MLKLNTPKLSNNEISNDVIQHITSYCDLPTLNFFARVSQGFKTLSQNSFENLAFLALLQAVIDDDQEKVKNILQPSPHLLLKTGTRNCIITGLATTWLKYNLEGKTPLQVALMRRQVEMIEIMLPYFDMIKIKGINGKEEARKQWQVCELSIELIKERKMKYQKKFITIIDEMQQDTFSIETFRQELLPRQAILLDQYFDLEHLLLIAHEVHDDLVYSTFAHDREKIHQFSIKIIGFIQSLVSPELAKIFCHGLFKVLKFNTTSSDFSSVAKILKMVNADEYSYYRESGEIVNMDGTGEDYFISASARPGWDVDEATECGEAYQKLYAARTLKLTELKKKVAECSAPVTIVDINFGNKV